MVNIVEIKDRRILLSKEIDEGSANDIIKAIFEINIDDDKKENEYRDFKREPIELYINSPGGTIYDGLAIIDAMRNSKTPVHTYCIGRAMSMAFIIFLVAEKRFAGKYCTFMYHEGAFGVWDKIKAIQDNLEESKRLQIIVDDIIKEKTSIMQAQLDTHKERKTEWYINAQDAVKLGICHGII